MLQSTWNLLFALKPELFFNAFIPETKHSQRVTWQMTNKQARILHKDSVMFTNTIH